MFVSSLHIDLSFVDHVLYFKFCSKSGLCYLILG